MNRVFVVMVFWKIFFYSHCLEEWALVFVSILYVLFVCFRCFKKRQFEWENSWITKNMNRYWTIRKCYWGYQKQFHKRIMMSLFKLTSSRCHHTHVRSFLLTSSFVEMDVDSTLAKRLRSFDIRTPSLIQQQVSGKSCHNSFNHIFLPLYFLKYFLSKLVDSTFN